MDPAGSRPRGMSALGVHVFNHHAMATEFQVRIAGEEKTYAGQAAQAAFAVADDLESKLSRFRVDSEVSRIAQLLPGESLRLSEPVFACLQASLRMERLTHCAFSITAAALKSQENRPVWELRPGEFSIRCVRGRLAFDLGAIGKGFALDRMAAVLVEWSCPAHLLVAGGSSVLAGDAPGEGAGWSCGLGEEDSPKRYLLSRCSLSGSGLGVKGQHILDPRTGQAVSRHHRAWALADTAAESDALSTASMVLSEPDILEVLQNRRDYLVFVSDGRQWRQLGRRPSPPPG